MANSESSSVVPFVYGDHEIRVVLDDAGDPLFVAADIARILGHRDVDRVTRLLDADEKGTLSVGTLGGTQKMSVITEPGLYRILARSNKPVAEPFQRWLFHEVLPAIRKQGSYVVSAPAASKQMVAEERERRLWAREMRLAEQEARKSREEDRLGMEEARKSRELARQGLHDFIELAGDLVTPEVRQAVAAKIAEVSAGEPMPILLPANTEADWVSPTQIAEMVNSTAYSVGRAITSLGLRGKSGMSKAVTNVAPGHHRPVTTYLYSPEAVELILAFFAKNSN